MPKVKTKRTATKRFKITGSGKILRKRIGDNHLLRKKTKKRQRALEQEVPVLGGQLKEVKRLLAGMV